MQLKQELIKNQNITPNPKFSSDFECGNLFEVRKVSENEYNLFVFSDTNNVNYFNWFYFCVEGIKKNSYIKFNIINLTSPLKLPKESIKPQVFSEKNYLSTSKEWANDVYDFTVKKITSSIRKGERLIGNRFNLKEEDSKSPTFIYYCYSFSYVFQYDNDKVYFSLNKIYSFRNLLSLLSDLDEKIIDIHSKCSIENPIPFKFLNKLNLFVGGKLENGIFGENNKYSKEEKENFVKLFPPEQSIISEKFTFKRLILCKSELSMPVYLLKIYEKVNKKNIKKKPIIIISCRVHAAETASSFVLEGFLKFIISQSKESIQLRKSYDFFIIPMLNPDGVTLGNSRNCFSGNDLNRCWNNPDQFKSPSIFYLKSLMQFLQSKKREIKIFCDLHGHSSKLNSFIYACHKALDCSLLSTSLIRILPKIFARNSKFFNYKECKFQIENDKANTGRVVAWKEFKITNSFTLESSMYGYSENDQFIKFNYLDYCCIGELFAKSLLEYYYVSNLINENLKSKFGQLKFSTINLLTKLPIKIQNFDTNDNNLQITIDNKNNFNTGTIFFPYGVRKNSLFNNYLQNNVYNNDNKQNNFKRKLSNQCPTSKYQRGKDFTKTCYVKTDNVKNTSDGNNIKSFLNKINKSNINCQKINQEESLNRTRPINGPEILGNENRRSNILKLNINMNQFANLHEDNKIVDKDMIYVRKKDKKNKLKVYNFSKIKNIWNLSEFKKKTLKQMNLTCNDFKSGEIKLQEEVKAKCQKFFIKSEITKDNPTVNNSFNINQIIANSNLSLQSKKRNIKASCPIRKIERLRTADNIEKIGQNQISNITKLTISNNNKSSVNRKIIDANAILKESLTPLLQKQWFC